MNGEDTNLAIFKTLGEIKETLGSQTAKIDNLRNELLGDGGRVKTLEAKIQKVEDRRWIHYGIIVPFTTALHAFLHWIGVPI